MSGAQLDGFARSAAHAGFAESLERALDELDEGLLAPDAVEGELGALYAGYREELDRLGRWDRGLLRSHAVERLRADLDAWHGEPVFAYGFEDLTGAEWALLEALAARTEVTVSLPVRAGTAGLRGAAADGRGSRRSRLRRGRGAAAALRGDRAAGARASRAGALRGRAGRGAAARRRDPLLRGSRQPRHARARRRGGARARPRRHAAGAIGIVVPGYDRIRGALETVLGSFGIPYAVDGELRLTQTPLVHALAALLRFAWARRDAQRPLPLPPLAVLGARAAVGRLRRGTPARPRRPGAGARRRGGGATARAGRCPRSRSCATPPIRSRRCGSSRSGCSGTRTASSGRRRTPRAGSICARTRR